MCIRDRPLDARSPLGPGRSGGVAEQMEPHPEARAPEQPARPESVPRRHSQPLRDRASQPAGGRATPGPDAAILVPEVKAHGEPEPAPLLAHDFGGMSFPAAFSRG